MIIKITNNETEDIKKIIMTEVLYNKTHDQSHTTIKITKISHKMQKKKTFVTIKLTNTNKETNGR